MHRYRIDPRHHVRILGLIMLLSLLFKVGIGIAALAVDGEGITDSDSISYHEPARALLHLGRFASSPDWPEIAETYRTPGYPLFLAAVYALFGEGYPQVIPVQIGISLGTMLLIYWIGRTLWSANVALLAVLIFAFDVASFTYTLKVMSETLFTFLLMGMVACALVLLRSPQRGRWAVLVGLLLTAVTLVRPITYYLLIPLLLILLGIGLWQKWKGREIGLVLAGVALPFLLVIGGWQVRNYALTGNAQYSSVEGGNLLFHRGAAVFALQEDVNLAEARSQIWEKSDPESIPMPDSEYYKWTAETDARWRQEAIRLITANPLLFVRSQIPGAVRLLAAPGEGKLLRMVGVPVGRVRTVSDYLTRFTFPAAVIASVLALTYLAFVYTGLLAWLWRSLRARRIAPEDLLIWGIVFYFLVISAGQGDSRFRVPIMPILILYGSWGWYQLQQRLPIARLRHPRSTLRVERVCQEVNQ
jgi:4-amino-4-deoxy-L-arabinose transferase-like glycosyltransferase